MWFDQLLQRPVLSFIRTRTRYVLPASTASGGIWISLLKLVSSPLSHVEVISYFRGALGLYPGMPGALTSATRHSIAANEPLVSLKLLVRKRRSLTGNVGGPSRVSTGL